jgi:hypothetical protein
MIVKSSLKASLDVKLSILGATGFSIALGTIFQTVNQIS